MQEPKTDPNAPRRVWPKLHGDRTRPSVALLLDYMSFLDGAYQSRVAETFHEAAERWDIDLLLVWGRGLDEPHPFSRSHNRIFDLIEPRSADGVVVVSAVLAAHCGATGVATFVERYAGLPIVSVGVPLPSVPSVVVDNRGAIETMVLHLIAAHGKRKIAFITGTPGSPESEERLDGYRAALARQGIAFDPALIDQGNFMHWPARAAVGKILERVGTIDALVAANDAMALGAMAALRERGLTVPGDVAVTGFDDLCLGRYGGTALTTAAQPFEDLAEQALALVLSQIEGHEVAPLTHVATKVILRTSCGCELGTQRRKRSAGEPDPRTPAEYLRKNAAELDERVSALLATVRSSRRHDARVLLEGLHAELAGQAGAFPASIDAVLVGHGDDYDHIQALKNVIDALREDFAQVADRTLEDLWYRALGCLTIGATTAGLQHRISVDSRYSRLLNTADRVSVALDLTTLAEAVITSLENVGIETACLSLFADETKAELEPLVSFVDGARKPVPQLAFPAAALLPPGSVPRERRRTLTVFPLVFELEWLGVAVFEFVPDLNGYQMLRDQFAAGLGHVTLHQQVLQKTRLHERSVQERQATTRRLEALSVLAGGVAHDLNNTLGPLVALPDLILAELGGLELDERQRAVLESALSDVHSMKSAGQRAAQTIKDLLTLGRQGRASKAALDLNVIVDAELRDPLRVLAREHPEVRVRLELHPQPLMIRASEAHVGRAVTNLVRNAAEAIPGRGSILIRTGHAELTEPLSGYETIAAGDYATVSVMDSGAGIPESEIEHVFEPFFSRKRLGERSGSGLGLAIVHGVAKEHEGFVDLQSRSGAGTTFTLYFPRVSEPSRIQSVPPPVRRAAGRILVVDDDPLQIRTARRMLSHLGYHVDVQQSGARALELVERAARSESGPYDLLLLDVTLNEERDGVELLRHLRQRDRAQKAVLVSGHAPPALDDADFATGVAWLAKPYTAETLTKAIHAALMPPECGLARRVG